MAALCSALGTVGVIGHGWRDKEQMGEKVDVRRSDFNRSTTKGTKMFTKV